MDEFAELAILHPENRFKESIENANESVLNRIAPLFKSEVSTNINRNDSSVLVLKILLKSLTYSDSLLCMRGIMKCPIKHVKDEIVRIWGISK